MKERPKIKPAPTAGDRNIEVLSALILTATWFLAVYAFSFLPETIPVHFDLKGNPNRFGSKANLVVLPIISTILYTGMTIINRYPHIFNYPVKITEENALRQYTNATKMLRVLKLVVLIVFFTIVFFTVRSASGATFQGIWILPFMLAVVYVPLGYFIVRAYRKK
jgi:uncharacterized membrane protein